MFHFVRQSNTTSTKPLSEDLIMFSVKVTSVAVILIVLNFLFVTLFNITAENQVCELRVKISTVIIVTDQ